MTEILTRKEVSEFFKMPIRTVDYLVTTGQIPFMGYLTIGVYGTRVKILAQGKKMSNEGIKEKV